MAPGEKIVYQTLAVSRAKAMRATEPAATALALFAAVTALLGTLLVGQAISRRFQLDARDNATLAALGTTRRERFVTSMVRLGVAVALGLLLAVGLAALLSVLTPVGPAEHAEPSAGFDFAAPIVVGGALVFLVVFVAVGDDSGLEQRPVRRARRCAPRIVDGRVVVRPRCAEFPHDRRSLRARARPWFDRSAHPRNDRRSDHGGHRGGGDHRVRVQPRSCRERRPLLRIELRPGDRLRRGVPGGSGRRSTRSSPPLPRTRRSSGSASCGSPSSSSTMSAVTSLSFAATEDAEPVVPTIAAGRAPAAADEIALGLTTMRELDVGIGDTVALARDGFDGDATVVGRVVLPGLGLYQGSDRTSIGVGGVVSRTHSVLAPTPPSRSSSSVSTRSLTRTLRRRRSRTG